VARLRADGTVDLSEAYAEGIGAWDKVSVTWGYQDFPPGTDESGALEAILARGRAAGLTYLTDQDARPTGSAHPTTHLWDNGTDAGAELLRMLQVRRAVLDRFGEAAVRRGMPLATLEEALVPLYLHHRYQVEAAVKVIGGQTYAYALRGDGQVPVQPVPAAAQLAALDAVLRTLEPATLAMPRTVLGLLPPRPAGIDRTRELFDRQTGVVFDAISPAAGAADLVLSLLFDPQRAARLVQQHALDPAQPSLEAVIDRVLSAVLAPSTDPYHAELGRAVQRVAIERLMGLAADAGMPQARAIAVLKLAELRGRLTAASTDTAARAHRMYLAMDISRFLDRAYDSASRPRPPQNPPGSPIGDLPPLRR